MRRPPVFQSEEFKILLSSLGPLKSRMRQEDRAAPVKEIVEWLARPAQVEAREWDAEALADGKESMKTLADLVKTKEGEIGWPGGLSLLLRNAEKYRFAYEVAKPVIAEFIGKGNAPPELLDFVARDYEGKINPANPTRVTNPSDVRRNHQILQAITALRKRGCSENAAIDIVAQAAEQTELKFKTQWREDNRENVRNAYRNAKKKNRTFVDAVLRN